MEDRSKRAETVTPQLGERWEKRRECDSVLSATNDERQTTRTWRTERWIRGRERDPGQPTAKEHQEHVTTHRPYRSWCKICVTVRGVNAPHRRSDAQDDLDGVPHVSQWTMGFLEKEIRGSCESWSSGNGDTSEVWQLRHWREIAQTRQEGSQTVPERPPVGESQSNGVIERAVGLVASQVRTLKAAVEHRIGVRVPPVARILCWLVEFAAYLMNRGDIGRDGKTALQRLHGRRDNTPIVEFGEKRSCTCPPNQREEESGSRGSTQECLLAL